MELDGKVAAITGATGSIGRGIAMRFARAGARLGLIDHDAAKGAALARDLASAVGDARFIHADVAACGEAQRAIDAVAASFGRLDILVNSLWSRTPWRPLLEKDEEDFRGSLELGLFGTLRAMRAAVPHMRRLGGGRIINIAAPYGHTSLFNIADAVTVGYSLQGLTRAAAAEWGQYQILTNLLVPSLVDIPEFQQYRAQNPAYVDALIAMMPLRRLGDPIEDIGGAALLLACDEGCFITGHPIYADGGQFMNPATFKPPAEPHP